MKLEKTYIPDLILIKPDVYRDDRGYFFESFRHDLLEEELGYEVNFIQDNESKSTKGVLRGLHYQVSPFEQSKLVRVIEGNVLDVVVDIRKNSPTFAKHFSIELSGDNKYQLFIPKGFAHGFVVLSEVATFFYKVDNYFSPENERGIAFDDNFLDIDWRLPLRKIYLSAKDKCNPKFLDTPEHRT